MREASLADEPGSRAARRDVARSLEKVGLMLWETGDVSGAAAQIGKSIELLEALAAEEPGDQDLRCELASSHDRAGMVRATPD